MDRASQSWIHRIPHEVSESLHLNTQLRLVAVLSVLGALALTAVAIALWEIKLARTAVHERVDRLHASLTSEVQTYGITKSLLRSEVNDPAVLLAWLLTPQGELASEYVARSAADLAVDSALRNPQAPWSSAGTGWWSVAMQQLWLAPVRIERPLEMPPLGTGSLIAVVDHAALWSAVASHLVGLPIVLLIGCLLALATARAFQRRISDPLIRLAVATRGGQWWSSEQQAGAPAPANAITEIIDNFESMRERLAEQERHVQQARQAAEQEVIRRTAELEARLKAAEETSHAKGEFLANMSHEIRTPMNGVVGMAELLSRTALDERQQRFLKSMRAAADSMVQIINDILDVTKIEAGKMDFSPEPFVLRDLIEDVGQLYAARAQTKGLELICRIEPSVPAAISGDMLRLRQVLGNLVSNAVKYTDRGEILLRVGSDERRDGENRLFFEVSDTGPGIPADQHEAIFEPYKQLSSAPQQGGGTGLGLPIAVRLVKLMGGSGIDLHSTVGHGSRFAFTLPCETAEAKVTSQPANEIRGMHVIVVDDNPSSYLFLEEVLTSWGAEVTLLSQGRLLLDRLRTAVRERTPIEAIVLDHTLPDISLREILRSIRLDANFSRLHVVLLSALDFQPERDTGITLAPDICISKPVRQQQLSDALRLARGPRATVHASEPAVVTPAQLAGPRPVAGLEVLVVDDNAINREVAAAMLEERGCRVTLAQDGAEAVVHATQQRFDLILMDCQMPGLDGYAATENIRREENGQGHAPSLIVALTANVMPRDRERCLSVGMNDVLVKPFSGAQLETILLRAEHERVPRSPATPQAAVTTDAGDEPDTVSVEALVESDLEPIELELFGSGAATVSPQPALPILDAGQIEAIRSLSKPRLLEQMCSLFTAEAPKALRSIEDALAGGDLTTVRSVAHALRSPASNLGGRRLAALLEHCETAASEGQLDAARQAGAQLRAAYGCLEEALRDLTERRTGT